MKKRILNISLILALMCTGSVVAQQGFGTNKPDKSAAVDISSTNKGLLIPRMNLIWNTTDDKIVAPVTTPAQGLLVYNKTTVPNVPEGFYYFSDGKWHPIGISALTHGNNTTISGTGTASDPYKVNIETASKNNLGVVKVGDNIDVDRNGVISVTFPPGTVDTNTKNKTLAVSGANLVLTDSDTNTVQVPLTDLDKQTLTYTASNNKLSISNGNEVDLSALAIDKDEQQLSLTSNTLSISNGNDVDLSKYLDNTDNQTITDLSFTANVLSVSLERGNTKTVDLSALAVDKDEQQLSLTGNTLSLERGGSVDLSALAVDTNSIAIVEGKKDAKANVAVTSNTVGDTTTYNIEVKNAIPTFFYMPSVLIDTSAATGSVNLYTTYTTQFGSPLVSSGSAETGGIPTLTAKELDFYVTYYDNTVINNIVIDVNGNMTYNVIGAPTNLSFANVVFKVRTTPKP